MSFVFAAGKKTKKGKVMSLSEFHGAPAAGESFVVKTPKATSSWAEMMEGSAGEFSSGC